MPLDAVAQQYAQTLYLARLEELSKKYSTRTAETAAALAKRGIYAHTAGQFHTEMARIGIEYVEELSDARVDALLTAYNRAGVPIDNEAVTAINRAAGEVFITQGGYLVARVQDRARQSGSPPGVAEALAGTIEARMSQIKSRINYKLSALRDEAILDARAADQRKVAVHQAVVVAPQPEMAARGLLPDIWIIRVWHQSAKWEWYGGCCLGACVLIGFDEFVFGVPLLLVSAVSLLSKLIHSHNGKIAKLFGAMGVGLALAIALLITFALKGHKPWSHLQKPVTDLLEVNQTTGSPPRPSPPPQPRSDVLGLDTKLGGRDHDRTLKGEPPPAVREQTSAPMLVNEPIGFLQFAKIQYVLGHEFFTLNQLLQANVYYINKGQAPVHSAYSAASMAFVSRQVGVSQSSMDATVLDGFERKMREETDKGIDVGVDTALWTTPSFPFPLTQEMIDGILSGQLVLYVTSHARWTDSYARPKETVDCYWLSPPVNPHPSLDSLVWHACQR